MAGGILTVANGKVVDGNSKAIYLRGAAIGGWMNMENFITGYPGHESQHRESMLNVLGKEKYDFFFDRWLYYFFTDADARFFKSLGLNCIRIPFNYRHFEDDMNPRVLKESGFKHLDRVIELCANNGIYTILDLHAVPGGQNADWHSDNPSAYAAFWDYKDHQDRTVWLWEQIAARYKDNSWVAGYNPLNEPSDSKYYRLPAFYERLAGAIRAIDPHHILWLDGNTYAMEWRGFDSILPNSVYSIHDYSIMGFPSGERYKGTPEQKQKLEDSFLRKVEFQKTHNAVIWNGEFGPVYADPAKDQDADAINQDRYSLLGEQLRLYDRHKIHWSIWLYKDIGLQGMVHTSPDSPWNRTIAPFLEKKAALQVDGWATRPSAEVDSLLKPLIEWIDRVSPEAQNSYPKIWKTRRHLQRRVLHDFLAASLSDEFASLFAGKTEEELESLARSFSFEECIQRDGLNQILSDHASATRSDD